MNKRRFIFLGLLFVILSSLGQSFQQYVIDVGDFNELQVIDDINVVYKNNPDSVGFAVFSCKAEVVPALIFSNNKNKLKIEQNTDVILSDKSLPTVTVYSDFLQYVENSGDSTVMIENPAPGPVFKTRVIGNGTIIAKNIHFTRTEGNLDTGKGHIVLSGVTRSFNFKNIGKGRIEASGLVAETGSIIIMGTGIIDCQVTDNLVVKGMGTGKVYVIGNPTIKKRALGSIRIVKVE